jgi:predicted dehydrogenase
MFLDCPDLDIVSINTPSGMHFEHGMEAIERWGKHVIIEKPTFLKPDQLLTAYSSAERKGLKVFPVFQNRYNKAVKRVKDSIISGELGEIYIMNVRTRWCRPQPYYDLAPWRGTFSHDGGALTNQGIHHVDLLRYLGGEIESVNTTMRTQGSNVEVEDTAIAMFKYSGNAVGSLEVTTAARPDDFEASLSIVASKGLAQIGGIAVNELQIFTPAPADCDQHSEEFPDCYGFGHQAMYSDIVEHFQTGATYPVSRDDALMTIRLLHSFYRSDEIRDWAVVDTTEQSSRLGRPSDEISKFYRLSEDN